MAKTILAPVRVLYDVDAISDGSGRFLMRREASGIVRACSSATQAFDTLKVPILADLRTCSRP